jgi:hypothetical protein
MFDMPAASVRAENEIALRIRHVVHRDRRQRLEEGDSAL